MQILVLIPGLGSDGAVWRRTIAALGDRVACLVGDMLKDDTLPAMARRILDQASPSFALAGISMGGMVSLELVKPTVMPYCPSTDLASPTASDVDPAYATAVAGAR